MLIRVVEYSQNKIHVAVVKSIKIAVEEINKTCKALKSGAFFILIIFFDIVFNRKRCNF
jgi:hypothetical protein